MRHMARTDGRPWQWRDPGLAATLPARTRKQTRLAAWQVGVRAGCACAAASATACSDHGSGSLAAVEGRSISGERGRSGHADVRAARAATALLFDGVQDFATCEGLAVRSTCG